MAEGGRPLALTFVAPNNNADRLAAAETLAANLTDAGLEVELRALAWDDYLQALTAGSSTCIWGRCGSPPTLISPPS